MTEVEVSAWAFPSSWHRKLRTRPSARFLEAHPGKHKHMVTKDRRRCSSRSSCTHLGGVEVNVIVLLVRGQVLVPVVSGGSHQHHPVAVLLTAAVQTQHYAVPQKNLLSGGLASVSTHCWKLRGLCEAKKHQAAPSEERLLPFPRWKPAWPQKAQSESV